MTEAVSSVKNGSDIFCYSRTIKSKKVQYLLSIMESGSLLAGVSEIKFTV